MSKPVAVFYAGANGSGKSTLRTFEPPEVKYSIDADAIAKEINPVSPRAADAQAGRRAIEMVRQAINERASFALETTLAGHSTLKRMALAKEAGFFVELRYVGLGSPDLNIARIAERVRNGGHHIDNDVVRRRYDESLRNLPAAVAIADIAKIYDNSKQYTMQLYIANCFIELIHPDDTSPWIELARQEIESELKTKIHSHNSPAPYAAI